MLGSIRTASTDTTNVTASDFTLIDSNRTIAAQYSLRVGVQQFNGTIILAEEILLIRCS